MKYTCVSINFYFKDSHHIIVIIHIDIVYHLFLKITSSDACNFIFIGYLHSRMSTVQNNQHSIQQQFIRSHLQNRFCERKYQVYIFEVVRTQLQKVRKIFTVF